MGCGGMLGEAFYTVLKDAYDIYAYDIDVNENWLIYGDVIDYYACKASIDNIKPDIIINLAALTSLEYCEQHVDLSYKTNTLGVENLVNIARAHNIPFVHISTAGIFDGKTGNYTEYDTPNPLCIYAKSKYEGEKIASLYKNSYIFRAGWMMGGGNKDKKFIKLIVDQIKNGQKTIYAVTDKQGTPTYTYNFVQTVINCIENNAPYGIYNTVCAGDCSRYDVAKVLCNLIDPTINVVPVTSDYFATTFFATRPPDESMRTFKLDILALNKMGNWKDCLIDYYKTKLQQYISYDYTHKRTMEHRADTYW